MLSLEQCRKLISDGDQYTDEEIEKIRNDLYELSDIILESYRKKRGKE